MTATVGGEKSHQFFAERRGEEGGLVRSQMSTGKISSFGGKKEGYSPLRIFFGRGLFPVRGEEGEEGALVRKEARIGKGTFFLFPEKGGRGSQGCLFEGEGPQQKKEGFIWEKYPLKI